LQRCLALSGCSGSRRTARGLFIGYVTDKTEEEVVAKVGKPDSVERASRTRLRWIYKKKTFDPDNQKPGRRRDHPDLPEGRERQVQGRAGVFG
jgi:hypothetical protein